MATPTSPTPKKRRRDWTAKFLEALRDTGNVRLSAFKAGIDRSTAYDHRQRNARFAADWDEAIEDSVDVLEYEARKRAARGVERPVYYQGKAVGVTREYSDTLLIFLLKAHRPEKYRDHFDLARVLEEFKAAAAGGPAPLRRKARRPGGD